MRMAAVSVSTVSCVCRRAFSVRPTGIPHVVDGSLGCPTTGASQLRQMVTNLCVLSPLSAIIAPVEKVTVFGISIHLGDVGARENYILDGMFHACRYCPSQATPSCMLQQQVPM